MRSRHPLPCLAAAGIALACPLAVSGTGVASAATVATDARCDGQALRYPDGAQRPRAHFTVTRPAGGVLDTHASYRAQDDGPRARMPVRVRALSP